MLRRERMQTASPSSADRPQRCGPAAPGRPQLRPATVPEVTVDGVVVVLEPSRWRRGVLRPLPSEPTRVRRIPSSASRSVHPNSFVGGSCIETSEKSDREMEAFHSWRGMINLIPRCEWILGVVACCGGAQALLFKTYNQIHADICTYRNI